MTGSASTCVPFCYRGLKWHARERSGEGKRTRSPLAGRLADFPQNSRPSFGAHPRSCSVVGAVIFCLPWGGWGSSGPPFLDLSKRSRFLSDFWTDFWSIFRRHKGAQNCQNIDFASTKCISLLIFNVKTRDFCAAFCKKPVFSQWKSMSKCISSRRNRYFSC